MAIEQGIWNIGDHPQRLKSSALADEALLEEMVMQDIAILNADWLLIGRQVRTRYDKFIDLLAMDANGSVIIIEPAPAHPAGRATATSARPSLGVVPC